MVDVGRGLPLVLVPGIQGRWEWMQPTVEALSAHFRVLTYTLAGERTSEHAFDADLGFDSFVVQIDRVLEDAGVGSAVLCGVSYGGLIALRYAAVRPARVRALVLASALPPDWQPHARARFYSTAPLLLSPLFAVGAVRRALPELWTAHPHVLECVRTSLGHLARVLSAPMSPRLMRDRIACLGDVDLVADASRVRAPVLLLTGDPRLEQVVPVALTHRYLRYIPDAERAIIERTGHLGLVTRPDAFAAHVAGFVRRHEEAPSEPARTRAAR